MHAVRMPAIPHWLLQLGYGHCAACLALLQEDGLAAQQQRAAPSRPAASKQQQGRMGPLNLQPVPPAAFHSQLPAARNASVWAGAGGGGGSAAGGSRKPKRGKGAEDEEYVPGREAAQTLHADEDDSDYDWNSKGGRKRHRQQGRRSGSRVRGGQQDVRRLAGGPCQQGGCVLSVGFLVLCRRWCPACCAHLDQIKILALLPHQPSSSLPCCLAALPRCCAASRRSRSASTC